MAGVMARRVSDMFKPGQLVRKFGSDSLWVVHNVGLGDVFILSIEGSRFDIVSDRVLTLIGNNYRSKK